MRHDLPKVLLKRKWLYYGLIWLSLGRLPVSGQLLAQTDKLSHPSVQQSSPLSLVEALTRLKAQYQVNILFEEKNLRNHSVSSDVLKSHTSLEAGLKALLQPLGLRYKKKKNNYIILSAGAPSKNGTESLSEKFLLNTLPPDFPKSRGDLSYEVSDTDKLVSGKVTDEKGEALPGVSILLKGTQQGTTTDAEGTFSLAVPNDEAVLVFSFVGYISQETVVGNRTFIDVYLKVDEKSLDEVVVVGYGEQSRKKVSTSISKVSGKDINHLPVTNPGDALAGLAAGVQVQAGAGGTPGANPIIRIRGIGSLGASNAPLYVVDGYPLPNAADFSRINVSDIESIEILKDAASAAIYGSRAANGVILVNTKRGRAGRPQFTFTTYTGVQTVANRIEVMNRDEYLNYMKDARSAAGLPYPDVYDQANLLPDTDWQSKLMRNAPLNKFELGARGGNDVIKYAVSTGYLSQKGLMKGTDYQLFTLRANLDVKLSRTLRTGVNFAPSFSVQNTKPEPRSPGLWGYSPIYAAMLMPPVVEARLDNGDYGQNNVAPHTQYGFSEVNIYNPLSIVELYKDRNSRFGVQNNLFLEWEPLEGLVLNTKGGALISAGFSEEYIPSTLASSRASFANISSPDLRAIGSSSGVSRSIDWIWENTLNYTRSIENTHNFSGLLLYSMQSYSAVSTSTSGRVGSFTNDLITNPSASNDQVGSIQFNGLNRFMSFVGRLTYDYKDKYLFTMSVRGDGSSKFGSNNRFGVFQSYSAGWRLSEEEFMKNTGIFDELKLRGSYGETGNANIGDFTWISGVSTRNYSFNNQRAPGATQTGFTNRDLTWEKSSQVDLGVNAAFFKNRISVSFDWYHKITRGMLFAKDLPGVVGYASSFQTNIGKLRNRGFELDINTQNMTGGFSWNTSLNIGVNRTNVLDLGGRQSLNFMPGTPGKNNVYRIEVGQPLGNMFGVIIDGVIKNESQLKDLPQWTGSSVGDYQVRDVNNDGAVNDKDRTLLGNGLPKLIAGLGNQFTYKNLDLGVLFQGVFGNSVINGASHHTQLWAGRFNAVKDMVNNYFDPTNPERDVKYARVGVRAGFNGLGELHKYAIENGSFVRLRNLTLGYTFKSSSTPNAFPAGTRVYLMGQNLFTLTRYSGMNPEGSQYGESVYQPGSDQVGYPVNKTFLVGVDIKF